MIVSGKISVKAVLQAGKRVIHRVVLLDSLRDKDSRYIEAIAASVPVVRLSRSQCDGLAQNTTHGGYLVECEGRISDALESLSSPALALLCVEGVSDPFNMGEICRSAYALGLDGIVTPEYDYGNSEVKLIRASAGASEHLWWHQAADLKRALSHLHQESFTIISAHRHPSSQPLSEVVFPERVCVCIGGALRGLSRQVLDVSDASVRLDYDARIALSTVGACSVFAYALSQQRRNQP